MDSHVDGSESAMGNGAADRTGKGESGVEGETLRLARGGGSCLLDDGVDLGRASRLRRASHCSLGLGREKKEAGKKGLSGEYAWRMQCANRASGDGLMDPSRKFLVLVGDELFFFF